MLFLASMRKPRKATAEYLEKAAIHYLARHAASTAGLRRLLARKVARSAEEHGTDPEEGAKAIETLIAKFTRQGFLDDRAFAALKTTALHRRGMAGRRIRQTLAAKGVDAETADEALAGLALEHADPEEAAAFALARRRKLGPFRPAPDRAARRDKDMAALARAGFSWDIVRKVIEAESPE
ncbi:MAG: RecX family transcriptional regulator [Rhodospirillales bacterium]|nr:RecX family transcriptional regulator [Rhodospirillales bacterium]